MQDQDENAQRPQSDHVPVQTLYEQSRSKYADALSRYADEPRWKTYPFLASIETYAMCNAACAFCPYPQLERQGEILSEALFEKIVADLVDADPSGPAMMTLSRVNEPFLDRRIFEFTRYIEETFPRVWINHITNASPLNEANFSRLLQMKRTSLLKISFNDHRPDAYERVMRIPYQRTIRNLRMIHSRKLAGEFWFPVRIGRVGDGTEDDDAYVEWIKQEFPAFEAQISPRFDWRGKIKPSAFQIPNLGCAQWFQLHILANGRDAFCCTDSDGSGGVGNASTQHVVHDIYNNPERIALREMLPSRQKVAKCMGCAAFA